MAETYPPYLFHLDLCILSYHLYHQSLVFPWDPYYEQSRVVEHRAKFMNGIRSKYNGKNTVHGPGGCWGWQSNTVLDPILTDYSQFDPWKASFVQAQPGEWDLIAPPSAITDRIDNWEVIRYSKSPYPATAKYTASYADMAKLYDTAQNLGVPVAGSSGNRPAAITSNYKDKLYLFEGGTGGIQTRHNALGTKTSTFHAWGMLGFVLLREREPNGSVNQTYDIHIVFRGSRSGSAGRALFQALFETGNPDWATDMDAFSTTANKVISPAGLLSMGFRESMLYTLPNILECLTKIKNHLNGAKVNQITVSGHSLGGALAVMCASALASGEDPHTKAKFAASFTGWPLDRICLYTYSAPTVGSKDFCVHAASKIYGFRIHVSGDPITLDLFKGNHIGHNIMLPNPSRFNLPSFDNHEPMVVRAQLMKMLTRANIPFSTASDYTPQFDKKRSFYDLIVANQNVYIGPNIDAYMNDYNATYAGLNPAITPAFPGGKSMLPLISNATPSGGHPKLKGDWDDFKNTFSKWGDHVLNPYMLLMGDQALLLAYQKTVNAGNIKDLNDLFQKLASVLYNNSSGIGKKFASSKALGHNFS